MANSQQWYMCHSMMQGSNENVKEIIGIVSISDYLIFSSHPHYTTSLLVLKYFLLLTCITDEHY